MKVSSWRNKKMLDEEPKLTWNNKFLSMPSVPFSNKGMWLKDWLHEHLKNWQIHPQPKHLGVVLLCLEGGNQFQESTPQCVMQPEHAGIQSISHRWSWCFQLPKEASLGLHFDELWLPSCCFGRSREWHLITSAKPCVTPWCVALWRSHKKGYLHQIAVRQSWQTTVSRRSWEFWSAVYREPYKLCFLCARLCCLLTNIGLIF